MIPVEGHGWAWTQKWENVSRLDDPIPTIEPLPTVLWDWILHLSSSCNDTAEDSPFWKTSVLDEGPTVGTLGWPADGGATTIGV
jgi:hypothetical protein